MRRVPVCWPTTARWQQNRMIEAIAPCRHRRSRPHHRLSALRPLGVAEMPSQERGHGIQGGLRRAETAHAGCDAVYQSPRRRLPRRSRRRCRILHTGANHRTGPRPRRHGRVSAASQSCRHRPEMRQAPADRDRRIAFNETSHPSAGEVWIGFRAVLPTRARKHQVSEPETAPPPPLAVSTRDPPGAAPGHRRLSHRSERRAGRPLRPRQDNRHARLPSLQQTGAREQADSRARILAADSRHDLPAREPSLRSSMSRWRKQDSGRSPPRPASQG